MNNDFSLESSVPNQNIIYIHKKPVTKNFLQISNAEWQYASRTMEPIGLQLYLYFAANKDNYKLALSKEAVKNAVGVKHTSYYKYLKVLQSKGYLVPRNDSKSVFDFYTTPYGNPLPLESDSASEQ